MKKVIAILLTTMMILATLVACAGPYDAPVGGADSQPEQPGQAGGQPSGETQQPEDDPPEQADGVVESLVIAITRDENTLTPFTYVTGTPGLDVLRLVYDSLFAFDIEGNVIPWMVSDYNVDSESLVFTMTLYDGQYWHDGVPLTAEDVRFTFEYMQTVAHTRWPPIANQIENIEVDDNVITMTLTQSNPDFVRTGLADMPIVPRHIFEGVEDPSAFDGATIGSSMFRLTEYVIGQYYVFEAFEGYFRGTPTVSRINMPIMTDAAAVTQALIAGQVSAGTNNLGPETFDVFRAAPGLDILSGRGFAPVMIKFNCEHEILSQAGFRRAIAYALDIEAMMNTIALGYATLGLPGFTTIDEPGARRYVFDPDVANTMLDDLGYTERDGNGIRLADGEPINLNILAPSGNAIRIRIAEFVQEYLEAIGIGVTVVTMEFDTLSGIVWGEEDFDMAVWGWSAPVRLDPTALFRLGATEGNVNVARLSDPQFDELADAFIADPTPEGRARISAQMQELIADLAPFINLWYADMNFAVNIDDFDGWVLHSGPNIGGGAVNRFSFLP